MPPLDNPRHERFAQELAKGKSAGQAYVEAGYKANEGNCIRLKGNERILGRVAELQERFAIRAEVTIASLTAELEEVRDLAIRDGQYAPAVAAIKEKAVLAGVRVEKSERKNTNVDRMSDTEISAALAEVEAALKEAGAPAPSKQLN